MSNFPIYIFAGAANLERSIGKFFKYGLIILAVMIGLAIVIKIIASYIYLHTDQKIKKTGIRKLEILEINKNCR